MPTDLTRGGLYGPAAATALEDLPYDARGILSGLYQVWPQLIIGSTVQKVAKTLNSKVTQWDICWLPSSIVP